MYGIIPRAIRDLFEYINYSISSDQASFEVFMNYYEIYMESLNNLLGSSQSVSENLEIGTHGNVRNAQKITVTSPAEIFHNIKMGQKKVQMAATGINERSSRSHTILVLEYQQMNKDGSKKSAKLNLVDLAGSERIGKTQASGIMLKEANKIN